MLYYAGFTHSFIDLCLAAVPAGEEQQYHLLKTRDLSICKTNKKPNPQEPHKQINKTPKQQHQQT